MNNLSKTTLSIAFLSGLALTGISAIINPSSAEGALIKPTGMTVSVPTTGNNGSKTGNSASQAYVDDIFLNTLSFGGTTFSSNSNINNSNFRAVQSAEVISGRDYINAEFGDLDDGKDGNDNPYVTAGVYPVSTDLTGTNNALRETTNPLIQDPAITSAFNGLSLNQGIDGESNGYTLDLIFQNGIVDNNSASDLIPELVFFERGVNSDFTVQAITGTLTNKIYSNTVTVNRSNMWSSGKYINTTEITSGQQLGIVGIDLSDFNIVTNDIVFGVRIASINNSGADLYGNFLSGDVSQFREIPTDVTTSAVPSPAVWAGYALITGILALFRRQSRRITSTIAVKAE